MCVILHIRNDGVEGVSSFGGSGEEFGAEDADVGEEKAFTCQFGTGKDEADVAIGWNVTFARTLRDETIADVANVVAV